MKGKILDFFRIEGGQSELTEAFIQNNQPQGGNDGIKVYSASTKDQTQSRDVAKNALFKDGSRLKIFDDEAIIITRKGNYAGTIMYSNVTRFTMTDNAYALTVKKKYKDKVNLLWFKYTQQENINKCIISAGGNKNSTFSKDEYLYTEIEIPDDVSVQNALVEEIQKIEKLKAYCCEQIKKIRMLYQYELQFECKYEKINEIFKITRGEIISERDIYDNYQKNGIPVYSSQTENEGIFGYVSREFYEMIEKKGEPNTITWTTDGIYAGTVFYRENEYLYTNVCGKLALRKQYKKPINMKYIQIVLNAETVKKVHSASNNGKLMKNQMSQIEIPVPDIDVQNEIANSFIKVETIIKLLEKTIKECNCFLQNKFG